MICQTQEPMQKLSEAAGRIEFIEAFPKFREWLAAAAFKKMGGVSGNEKELLNTSRAAELRGLRALAAAAGRTISEDELKEIAGGNVERNRRRAMEALRLGKVPLYMLDTCNGNDVAVLNVRGAGVEALESQNFDAVILTPAIRELAVGFSTADCTSAFFVEEDKEMVALAHLGWQGVDKALASKVVGLMGRLGADASRIKVWIGPSIGPCCYWHEEVSQKNDPRWKPFVHEATAEGGKQGYAVDLWSMLEHQLREAGIRPENIVNPRICTACRETEYFSHSARHGENGRTPSILCLR